MGTCHCVDNINNEGYVDLFLASPVIRINDHSQPLTETSGTDQILSGKIFDLLCLKLFEIWDLRMFTLSGSGFTNMIVSEKLREN